MEHFEKAMKRVMPSVNAIDKARYMELKKTFAPNEFSNCSLENNDQ